VAGGGVRDAAVGACVAVCGAPAAAVAVGCAVAVAVGAAVAVVGTSVGAALDVVLDVDEIAAAEPPHAATTTVMTGRSGANRGRRISAEV